MPKFDDRFARQNRYGPPPEFPLASASSGIVHHLSGPNEHALARPRRRGDRDRPAMRLRRGSRLVLPSLCSRVSYCPAPRARVRLLGPCFKTGRRGDRLQPQTPGVQRGPPEQDRRRTAPTASSRHGRLRASKGAPALGGRGISPRPPSRQQRRAYNTPPKRGYLARRHSRPSSRSRPPPRASAAAPSQPNDAAPEGHDAARRTRHRLKAHGDSTGPSVCL